MSFGTKSVNNQQSTATNNLNAASSQGLNTSNTAANTGFGILNSGQNLLNNAGDYYHSILQGGSAADAALAPDINRTRQAAEGIRQSTETLAPRGGGRGSVLFNLPGEENSQVQSVFNTARGNAAQGEGQVGAAQGGVGAGVVNSGVGYLNAGGQAAGEGFKAGTQQYTQQQQAGSAIGSAAGGIAQALIPLFA